MDILAVICDMHRALSSFFKIERERSRAHFGPATLIAYGDVVTATCPHCGAGEYGRKSFENVVAWAEGAGAKMWTDHIGGWELIFSERVIDAMFAAGVEGFVAHPLNIGKVDSDRLAKLERPNYFLIEVTGRVDIDRQLFDEGEGSLCPVCGSWRPKRDGKYYFGDRLEVPRLETWDGSDFVMQGNVATVEYCCTPRIVELVRKNGWSGFAFRSFTPRLGRVNLKSENWLAEFEVAAADAFQKVVPAMYKGSDLEHVLELGNVGNSGEQTP